MSEDSPGGLGNADKERERGKGKKYWDLPRE